nr:carcinoembryonic antigen-related cell adhesion molecule 3-like isoform X1 [Chrysemys picta bellii]
MGQIPHRPGGPWTGILLAASVLGSCLQPAPAQTPVTIVLTPPSPVVGGGVSLAPKNPPQRFLSCIWYRSVTADENSRILTYFPPPNPIQQNGSAHTGRETLGPGCALNMAGLMLNYTGNYTVLIASRTNPILSTVVLHVSDAPSGLSLVAGIVIGSLVGVALVGAGVYLLYARCRNETPKENGAPVLVYKNLPPTSWVGSVAQSGNPPDPSPTYQTLQPRQPDVYEDLKK